MAKDREDVAAEKDGEEAAEDEELEEGEEDLEQPLLPKGDDSEASSCESYEEDIGGQGGVDPLVWSSAGFIGLVCLGVAGLMHLEGLSFVTALYVITQVVTTIGYGDFTVQEEATKFYVAFYVMLLLVFVAYAYNPVIEAIQKKEGKVLLRDLDSMTGGAGAIAEYRQLIVATFAMLGFVAFGTVFYATYERCACSYGKSHIDGCISEPDGLCSKTGGIEKGWRTSFYMSVITLTTVGFGDHSPRSQLGRIIAVPWMLLGVAAMANWFNEMRNCFVEKHKAASHKIKEHRKLEKYLVNTAECERLKQAEYRCLMLCRLGKVDLETIQHIDALFHKDNAMTAHVAGVHASEILGHLTAKD